MALDDYKNVIATTASITTIAQFCSGMLICHKFIKWGHTGDIAPLPFVIATVGGILNLLYGSVLHDTATILVNFIGMILNGSYVAIYYTYTKNKDEVRTWVLTCAMFVCTVLAYVWMEAESEVEFRLGVIVTMVSMMTFASPLLSLKDVIATQSTQMLPFPVIVSGTFVTFQWFLYGLIIKNIFVKIQNAVGFLLCLLQLSLFVIYPSKKKTA